MHGTKLSGSFSIVALVGLAVHSFVDGIVMAGAFEASESMGNKVAWALIIHKIPDGFVMSALMAANRNNRDFYSGFSSNINSHIVLIIHSRSLIFGRYDAYRGSHRVYPDGWHVSSAIRFCIGLWGRNLFIHHRHWYHTRADRKGERYRARLRTQVLHDSHGCELRWLPLLRQHVSRTLRELFSSLLCVCISHPLPAALLSFYNSNACTFPVFGRLVPLSSLHQPRSTKMYLFFRFCFCLAYLFCLHLSSHLLE